jgi:hypothetical protein
MAYSEVGAPQSMKMGNTLSPWRYDAFARAAPQSPKPRLPAIFHYAGWRCLPDLQVILPQFNRSRGDQSEIDMMEPKSAIERFLRLERPWYTSALGRGPVDNEHS